MVVEEIERLLLLIKLLSRGFGYGKTQGRR
jgi:hypothetical protein